MLKNRRGNKCVVVGVLDEAGWVLTSLLYLLCSSSSFFFRSSRLSASFYVTIGLRMTGTSGFVVILLTAFNPSAVERIDSRVASVISLI